MRYRDGMPNTAATYCRISYDPKGTEAGVDRQQADTDALAERLGFQVVERITDNDRSASRGAPRREGFDHLLGLASTGQVDAVVVYDLDRFSRNPDELGPWIDAAERHGVQILSTGSVIDLATSDGVFSARLLLAVAEKESKNISRRVEREARSAAEKGTPRWSTRPFGFERDGSHVIAEADELRAIYNDVIAGRSMASIAFDLNDRAVEKPGRGDRWQSATIGFLVRAARNAGLREYRGEVCGPGAWEPIVSEETWRNAIAALDARKAGSRPAARSLLSGLVRCSGCGRVMSRSGRSYRCMPRSDGYLQTCGITVSGDRLDEYATGLVLAALGDVEPHERSTDGDGDVSRARADVARLRSDADELAGMFGRGELTLSAFKAAKQPLDARAARAEADLAQQDTRAALTRLTGPASTLADRWDELDVELRSRIVNTVIDRFTIAKTEPGTRLFSPARVDVSWRA